MGQKPVAPSDFCDYLGVVRGLLNGDEVVYSLNGESHPIRFQDSELGCLNLEDPIPIYVGANGPKVLAATGKFGDGRISAGTESASVMQRNMERVRRSAASTGRIISHDFHTAALTYACILKRSETLQSSRVIEETGAPVVSSLHFWYEIMLQRGNDEFILDGVREEWEEYKRYVENMPLERRHQTLHNGHCAFLPEEERRFVTANMIKATAGLVGEPDEVKEKIIQLEKAGLKEIILLPPVHCARSNFMNFADVAIE